MIEKNEKDLITVLLPCCRVDNFFEKAVCSIFQQTHENFELIIIANGVTNDDLNLITAYCQRDSRVKVVETPIKGLVFALNLGIHLARGNFIARMDADDISDSNRLALQLDFLKNNINCDLVGSRVKLIDEHDIEIDHTFPFYMDDIDIKKILPVRNVLCHSALMFKRDSLLKVGGYKYGFMSEDHEMFLRMMNMGFSFHNIDETLYYYRRHSNQVTDIKHAWKNFYEISAFLYMHAFRDKNLKCLLGIVAVFPLSRFLFKNFKKLQNFLFR